MHELRFKLSIQSRKSCHLFSQISMVFKMKMINRNRMLFRLMRQSGLLNKVDDKHGVVSLESIIIIYAAIYAMKIVINKMPIVLNETVKAITDIDIIFNKSLKDI